MATMRKIVLGQILTLDPEKFGSSLNFAFARPIGRKFQIGFTGVFQVVLG